MKNIGIPYKKETNESWPEWYVFSVFKEYRFLHKSDNYIFKTYLVQSLWQSLGPSTSLIIKQIYPN